MKMKHSRSKNGMEYKKLLRLNLSPNLCAVGIISQIHLKGPVHIQCLQGSYPVSVRCQSRQEVQMVSNKEAKHIKDLAYHIKYSKAQQESLGGRKGRKWREKEGRGRAMGNMILTQVRVFTQQSGREWDYGKGGMLKGASNTLDGNGNHGRTF